MPPRPRSATAIDRSEAELLASRFALLADPTRLMMLAHLIESGQTNVGELAAKVGASESAASHQLRQLRLAGLVRPTRRGRAVFYEVADEHVATLVQTAATHYLLEGRP